MRAGTGHVAFRCELAAVCLLALTVAIVTLHVVLTALLFALGIAAAILYRL